jgi:hypothetical protein
VAVDPRDTPGSVTWPDQTAALHELRGAVAVQVPPATTTVRRPQHELRALRQSAFEARGALLDARSMSLSREGAACSRFAGDALIDERLDATTLQLRLWPAAALWRATLFGAG